MKNNSFLSGNVLKSLAIFTLPVLGALILQAAYGAVDVLVVGLYASSASVLAVGTGSTVMSVVTFVITSLAMGSTVIIGQHIGEKRPEKAGDAVGTTVILFSIVAVIVTVLMEIFAEDLAKVLNCKDEALPLAVTYIRICSAGIPIIVAYNVISCILRGSGNANLPFIFVGVACAVNVIGDFLLVGLLKMDAAGAAIATISAQGVSVVVSLFVLKKQKLDISFSLKQCKIYKKELRLILKVGAPIAIQEFLVEVSFLVITAIINRIGENAGAGYAISQKIISFILLVPSALMQSVSAFVAQNIGAGQKVRAKKGFKYATICGAIIGVFFFLLGFFGGEAMSLLFTSEKEVAYQSASYLKGFSIECILTNILFASIGYFNGCGKSLPVMIVGIVSAVFIRIPLCILAAAYDTSSLLYIGYAVPLTTVFGLLFFFFCFLYERKKELRGKAFSEDVDTIQK